jgi:hypothetical protein
MISFIIQFRYDSNDRLNNLLRGIIYLNHHFKEDGEIIVIDQDDNEKDLKEILKKYEISNVVIKSLKENGPYHRSKVINEGLRMSKNNLCLVYDCDILLPIHQIKASILLANNGYDVVYPFCSAQYDIPQNYFREFKTDYDFEEIEKNISPRRWGEPDYLMFKHGHGGFGMLINKKSSGNLAYFNEDFNGWGHEDGEFLFRLNKFGAKITRAWGPVYHVEHDRTLQFQSNDFTHRNMNLYHQLQSMDNESLINYYKERNLIN